MTMEEMKRKIEWAGKEAWLKGNLAAFDEVYAEDYVWHRPPFPDTSGLAAVKESIEGMREAYTELEISYDEMVAEGDSIAYRYTFRGRHTGQSPTLPIPPSGKVVTLVGTIVVHVADGKIVEEFEHSDYLGFLQQLGVVPALG
ncbi:MAG: ester cyclase [Chloroflexota bacterium]